MKRISRVVVVTLFSLLVLGSTRSFADPGKGNNGKGNSNSQGSNKGQGNGGGIIGWIDGILQDIFGGSNDNSGNGKGGSPAPNSIGTPPYAGGGGTAPIDGGLSLLLVAGVGLGVKKAIGRKEKAE
jgi:hypothetical protein